MKKPRELSGEVEAFASLLFLGEKIGFLKAIYLDKVIPLDNPFELAELVSEGKIKSGKGGFIFADKKGGRKAAKLKGIEVPLLDYLEDYDTYKTECEASYSAAYESILLELYRLKKTTEDKVNAVQLFNYFRYSVAVENLAVGVAINTKPTYAEQALIKRVRALLSLGDFLKVVYYYVHELGLSNLGDLAYNTAQYLKDSKVQTEQKMGW